MPTAAAVPFDVVILHGHIIDGTGSPWYDGEIGIRHGRIDAIGSLAAMPAKCRIDAAGKVVAPGFIDMLWQGAVGLSTSLQYAPAPYAKTEELIALAAEAAKMGGIYATHMRSEGDGVLSSIDETARIGREAHIPVEIWHLKAAGKANWGRMPDIVARIEQVPASGVEMSANSYGYTAWFNSLSAFIPPWAHYGGDAKLLARLADPTDRARIRQDMPTPGGD